MASTAGEISETREVAANESSVSEQMEALRQRARCLVLKESILGKRVIAQIKELIAIGDDYYFKLVGVEEKEVNVSRELEEWLENVDDAISIAEDSLDQCAYHLRPHLNESKSKVQNYLSPKNSISTCSNLIERGNLRLRELLEKIDQFSSVPTVENGRSVAAHAVVDSSETESQVLKEFERDGIRLIVDGLLNSDNEANLSIVSLVGWAETGKTALARLVYKNDDVMFHFDERMWVQAPLDFDTDKVAKCMLSALTCTMPPNQVVASTEGLILPILRKRLKGKKYLLVLDDVSEVNATRLRSSEEFLISLGGSRGSKVLITTGVRPKINSSLVHEMRLGSSTYLWNLFERIAFGEKGALRTQNLVEMGRALVDECQGNPLYIKLLGSLLHRMKDSQWSIIQESLMDSSSRGIPKLCFDYMASLSLKRCFQYCCIFPKGYLMRREELIQLWMAQGYLNLRTRSGPDMVNVGLQYYDILLKSSFLQVSEDDDFDRQSCKLPDSLRDAFGTSESCFATKYDRNVFYIWGAVHLSLINCKVMFSKELRDDFSNLRTLRLENTGGLGDLLACAEALHVLIVVDGSIAELPTSIGKLKLLKYLDISRTKIVMLPDSITALYNLQTLRLYDLQDLPRSFENLLVSLRHIYVQNPTDLAKLKNLPSKFHGLMELSPAKASYREILEKGCKFEDWELQKFLNLFSSISFHCLENVTSLREATKAGLSKMYKLESLKLHWSATRENSSDEDVLEGLQPNGNLRNLAIENFKGTAFPSWVVKLDNLLKLELGNCSWFELPALGSLPSLITLKITGMDNVHRIADEFYGFKHSGIESSHPSSSSRSHVPFRALKELTLYGMSNLEKWDESKSGFPSLVRVEVEQCPKLNCIPDIVLQGNGSCLRKLRIALCENLTHLPKMLGEVESPEELELFGLPFLKHFSIGRTKNLKCLTIGCFSSSIGAADGFLEQLECLSTLTSLTLWGYGQKAIPDWIVKFPSLTTLKLEFCAILECFPSAEKMQQLSNLKELNICYCPLLVKNCTIGRRPEWHKVSHIPTIIVNNETLPRLQQPS